MEAPIKGAKGVLFNIIGGPSVTTHEVLEVSSAIGEFVDEDAQIIWGHVLEPEMDDKIQVIVIATGFSHSQPQHGDARMGLGALKGNFPPKTSSVERPKHKPELEEAEVRPVSNSHGSSSPSVEEDLFRGSGAPTDDLDVPAAYRRRRRPS